MKKLTKFIYKSLTLSAICLFLAQSAALASGEAVLKAIKIDLMNNQDYRVIIKTDKDVPVKKYITAANKIVLDMKNTRPAQFVNTVYNNASEVDHVIVQPVSNDRLRIFLQATGIAFGKIILDTRDEALDYLPAENLAKSQNIQPAKTLMNKKNPGTEKFVQGKNQVEPLIIDLSDKKTSKAAVNNSVDKIKSVTPVVSYVERSKNNYNTVKNSMMNRSVIGSVFGASIFDWILRFLMLAVIIAGGIRFLRKPKNIEIDIASQSMKSREMNLYKSADAKKELLTRSLGMPAQKENAAKKPNYSSISRYGLNEYKNSQLPPKKTTSPISANPGINLKPASQNTTSLKSKPRKKIKQLNQTKMTQSQTNEAKQNFDGVKFLETMASIYQKSGRSDLASGIRQSIIQKQQSA